MSVAEMLESLAGGWSITLTNKGVLWTLALAQPTGESHIFRGVSLRVVVERAYSGDSSDPA